MPPPQPKPGAHRLPPMLRMSCRRPMAGYSKGARGLFVLWREIGILTDTAVSPSLRRRQPSSRYAIHAGRNLPDKEFRYLRTVQCCCSHRALLCEGLDISARLCKSPYSSDYIIPLQLRRVRHIVSEDSQIASVSLYRCSVACLRRSWPAESSGSLRSRLALGAVPVASIRPVV